jgi:hypothetical protein
LGLVLVLFCFLPGSAGEAPSKPVRRVLIFNEVGTAYPGINLMDQGIRSALRTSSYKLEVYREYMDTLLFPDPADQQRFRDFYIRKYQNRKPDVIITVGPSPLKFMLETHHSAFRAFRSLFVCRPGTGTPCWIQILPGLKMPSHHLRQSRRRCACSPPQSTSL